MRALRECLAPLSYLVEDPLPGFVMVFDSKSGLVNKPRLAISRAGAIDLVLQGDATVLEAQDLESVSLVDREAGLYVASTSIGVLHVFVLQQLAQDGPRDGGQFAAKHVARGQLPVPDMESTKPYPYEANRTNIEAMRYIPAGSPCIKLLLGDDAADAPSGILIWGARGGKGYAGVPGWCSSVWVRCAPFHPKSATVDTSRMKQSMLPNIGDDGRWRALSSLDVDGDIMYFTAAFDGEGSGLTVEQSDDKRAGASNPRAFRSIVGSKHLVTGDMHVLGSFDGMKLEGILKLDSERLPTASVNAKSNASDRKQFLLLSDDESLGCLAAKVYVSPGRCPGWGCLSCSERIEPGAIFRDFGEGASARYPAVKPKRWGPSGIAPLATLGVPAHLDKHVDNTLRLWAEAK